jgi:hypothetical protein
MKKGQLGKQKRRLKQMNSTEKFQNEQGTGTLQGKIIELWWEGTSTVPGTSIIAEDHIPENTIKTHFINSYLLNLQQIVNSMFSPRPVFRILGSVPSANGAGSGSCSFRH